METDNKAGVPTIFFYEFIGTAFLMYAQMLSGGVTESLLTLQSSLNFVMLVLAWNISGGHFNPAISIGMCIATKKIGAHAKTLLVELVAQFLGGMFGLCLGFLSILDIKYMND